MGGSIDRRARTWQVALAAGAAIEQTACAHHVVPPGYRVIDRVLDEHICNHIVSGAVAVEIGGRSRTIATGGALWIGPGVQHTLSLPDPARPFAMLNLRFRVQRDGRRLGLPSGALLVDDASDLRPLWELAVDDRQQLRPDRLERFRHLLALLHGDLARRQAGERPVDSLGRHRRQALAAWLATHLHERPTPADLAAVVGLSPDWFRRAFLRSYGLSPRAWIVRERVRRAERILADEPGTPIGALAVRLGYEDHRLLDRQFRALRGVSPAAWRRC